MIGYADVGDGCWRPNVLLTSFGCCWQVTSQTSRVRLQHQISVINIKFWHNMMLVTDWDVTIMQKRSPKYFFVTNILKWSPSLSHQHNDVTNITVTIYHIGRSYLTNIKELTLIVELIWWSCEFICGQSFLNVFLSVFLGEERDDDGGGKFDWVPKDLISCTSDPYTRWNSEKLDYPASDQSHNISVRGLTWSIVREPNTKIIHRRHPDQKRTVVSHISPL